MDDETPKASRSDTPDLVNEVMEYSNFFESQCPRSIGDMDVFLAGYQQFEKIKAEYFSIPIDDPHFSQKVSDIVQKYPEDIQLHFASWVQNQ